MIVNTYIMSFYTRTTKQFATIIVSRYLFASDKNYIDIVYEDSKTSLKGFWIEDFLIYIHNISCWGLLNSYFCDWKVLMDFLKVDHPKNIQGRMSEDKHNSPMLV